MSSALSVAIVHHHLRGGGVTQIIRQQCALLKQNGIEVVVFSGEEGPDDFPAEVVCVPGLGYATAEISGTSGPGQGHDSGGSSTTPGTGPGHDGARSLARSGPEPGHDSAKSSARSGASQASTDMTDSNHPQSLLSRLDAAADQVLSRKPTLWHIHNHALGKNPVVTAMVALMAEQGRKLLLHIHDFAEDNRPHNYLRIQQCGIYIDNRPLRELCYPTAGHVHYAVLNGRDYANLKRSGVPDAQLHLLPNPVGNPARSDTPPKREDLTKIPAAVLHTPSEQIEPANTPVPGYFQAESSSSSPPEHLILYPVRVIPRKNIGEMVFWSAVSELQSPGKTLWAATLPPKNPAYREHYSRWHSFCADHRLPVLFEAGDHLGLDFPDLIKAASCVFTSSMAEGFGMVYLEPWLAGKPLAGRLLPDITQDFSDNGVQFPGMYTRVMIPLRWLDAGRLREKMELAITGLLRDYGFSQEESAATTTAWMQRIFSGDTIDFGVLDDESQREVITYVLSHPETARTIPLPMPWSASGSGDGALTAMHGQAGADGTHTVLIEVPNQTEKTVPQEADSILVNRSSSAAEIIATNRLVVTQTYSPDAHLQKIRDLYTTLALAPVTEVQYISGADLLEHFLKPDQFTLQRVSG